MTVNETPCFFSQDPLLYGVVSDAKSKTAVLFVTCFGEEKKSSYRNIVEVCRYLLENGVSSLRFDLRGTGDSDFNFSNVTLEGWIEDVKSAYDYLVESTDAERILVIGLRFGAFLACMPQLTPEGICLLAPPKSGALYIREELMKKQLRAAITGNEKIAIPTLEKELEDRGFFDLDGIEFPALLYNSMKELTWEKSPMVTCKNIAVAFFSRKDTPGKAELLAGTQLSSTVKYVHIPSMPFWNQTDHVAVPQMAEKILQFCLQSSAEGEDK